MWSGSVVFEYLDVEKAWVPMKCKRLNLGCGRFPKKGFINVDVDPEVQPDVIHDLNVFPYPFRDNEFEWVEANHVLEHLDDPFRAMKEIHRITRPGGIVVIRVPHFSRGFTNPDHKRGFDITFPYYFRKDFLGGYVGVEYRLERMRLRWFAQPYLKKHYLPKWQFWLARIAGSILDFLANLSPELCSRVWCYWVGGFEEIEFWFRVVKEG